MGFWNEDKSEKLESDEESEKFRILVSVSWETAVAGNAWYRPLSGLNCLQAWRSSFHLHVPK